MKAAIFDLDGTLLDSLGVWDRIDVEFLARRSLEVPTDYVEAISAMTFRETAEYTIRRFGLTDTPEALMAEWHDMAVDQYSHHIPLKPHAGDYLRRLAELGVGLGVATSLTPELCEPALCRHGIRDLFRVVCHTGDVLRGKEHPDLFVYTAGRLGVPPRDCVVFEDLLPAIRAARRAGIPVCGVYDDCSASQWPEIRQLADWAITDFRDAPLP